MKRCSWCGRIVKEDLLLCSHCHHSFSVSKSSAKKTNKDVKKVRNVSTAVACSKANDKYNNNNTSVTIENNADSRYVPFYLQHKYHCIGHIILSLLGFGAFVYCSFGIKAKIKRVTGAGLINLISFPLFFFLALPQFKEGMMFCFVTFILSYLYGFFAVLANIKKYKIRRNIISFVESGAIDINSISTDAMIDMSSIGVPKNEIDNFKYALKSANQLYGSRGPAIIYEMARFSSVNNLIRILKKHGATMSSQ